MKNIRQNQEELLLSLLKKASQTEFGRKYHFDKITSYEDYKKQVPLHYYKDIEENIERIKSSEPDILWPGVIDKFAVSAGTTGHGKHLPLTSDRLASDKRFMKKVIMTNLIKNPDPGLFAGYHVSLPGSIENAGRGQEIMLGEISGFLSLMTPSLLKPFQVVSPSQLAEMPWKPKFALSLDRALQKDVRVITAVPSWTLIFLQKAIENTGCSSVREIWPNLRLIVCGGAALDSYKKAILNLCQGLPVRFIENYGASEGYFSFTDDSDGSDMRLVTDNGIFFEWIPYSDSGIEQKNPVPTWEVEAGKKYILCVTTNAGLWRYIMNDVILFTQTNPPRIKVDGRVSDLLDRYGEALSYKEASIALNRVLTHNQISYQQFLIGSHLDSEKNLPLHYWFIISDTYPDNISSLARDVDTSIQAVNRHYAIRRESGALALPEFFFIKPHRFNRWFEHNSQTRAQTKMSKILYKDEKIASLIELSRENSDT